MGLKGYHLKTRVNRSIRICELLKPMQIALDIVSPWLFLSGLCLSALKDMAFNKRFRNDLLVFAWDSKRYHYKTHTNDKQVMPPTSKTHANTMNC